MLQLPRLFAFLLFIGVLATTMRLVRDIPLAFASDEVRLYQAFADVENRFRGEVLLRPSYFPRSLAWPADEIWAGRAPGDGAKATVLMHFAAADSDEIVLAIAYAQEPDAVLSSRIEPERRIESGSIRVQNVSGELILGQCANQRVCNQIRWRREGRDVIVTGRFAAQELQRIASGIR